MKQIKRLATIAAFLVSMVAVTVNTIAAEPALDEARIKTIVKEVIRENPKLILDSVNRYTAEQKIRKQEQQLEASFNNRLTDSVVDGNPQKGPFDAPITIIEYTDFQCPYCARGARTLEQVRQMYPGKVRVVFKNLPLKMHGQALPAAKAALAAHRQDKFWEYHDLLFKNANTLNDGIYVKLAAELGLNIEQLEKDIGSESVAAQIRIDEEQARKLGFTGTPRFLVNGVEIKGAYPPDYFASVIDRLLEETKE